MKIRIDRRALGEELARVRGITRHRTTLAILGHVLAEASDGVLKLTATNLDLTLTTSCACEVIEAGSVALPADILTQLVSRLTDDEVEIETEENHWGHVRSGASKLRIMGAHPDDFPQAIDPTSLGYYPVDAAAFSRMVDKTLFSTSTDNSRPQLQGVMIQRNDGHLEMASTDGHRLSRAISEIEQWPSQDPVVVPTQGLVELKRNLGDELGVAFTDSKIVFGIGPATLVASLIDARFPDLDQVLPRRAEDAALIDREVLEQGVRLVSLCARKSESVRFSLSDEGLELYGTDPDTGEARHIVPVEYSGGPVKTALNFRYVLDVLSAIEGDVRLQIDDTLSPVLLTDTDDDSGLWVIMPMRL